MIHHDEKKNKLLCDTRVSMTRRSWLFSDNNGGGFLFSIGSTENSEEKLWTYWSPGLECCAKYFAFAIVTRIHNHQQKKLDTETENHHRWQRICVIEDYDVICLRTNLNILKRFLKTLRAVQISQTTTQVDHKKCQQPTPATFTLLLTKELATMRTEKLVKILLRSLERSAKHLTRESIVPNCARTHRRFSSTLQFENIRRKRSVGE